MKVLNVRASARSLIRLMVAIAGVIAAVATGVVAVAGPASAASAPVIGNGVAAFTVGDTAPGVNTFDVATLVQGGISAVDATSLKIVTPPPAADATSTVSASSSHGLINTTFPTSGGATGPFSLTFGYCAPGDGTWSAGDPNCSTGTLTYHPSAAQEIGEAVTVLGVVTEDIYQNVDIASVAPATAAQGSVFTISNAAVASAIPASDSGFTVNYASLFAAITPVPSGLTYVPGSLKVTGGDAITEGQATATYCTATGTGCDAQINTGNYKTNYPYLEVELPSSIHVTGGSTVTMPTISAQFTATGSPGSVEPVDLSEFKVDTNVSTAGNVNVDGYPTTGSSGTPPYAAPTPLSTTTITPDVPPTITSAGATTFTTGSTGSFTVTSTGAPTPTLSETGALPPGVTFTDNGNGTATIGGTATAEGSYPITIQAANGASPNATQSFTLTVDGPPSITSAGSATFTEGNAGSFTVTSSATPTAALSETGALPAGVTFDDNGNGSATLSGNPTVDGVFPLTITAANGFGPNATQNFTLTVDQPPSITSAASTTFTVGSAGSFTITSSGLPTASVSETGALPAGVTLVNNGDGTAKLAGTPGAGTSGSYTFTLDASNGVLPVATQSFTLTVDVAPTITSASATTFAEGSTGSFTVTSSGLPTASLGETGALPAGVSFTDNGDGTATLAGTPAVGSNGIYPLTISASNGIAPEASQAFTLTVDQAPAITSASATTFTAGSAGSFTVTSTGRPTASLTETGALPSGVNFVDNGNGTATLAGTPAAGTGGSYSITLHASNGVAPAAAQSFMLTVDQAPAITSAVGTTFTAGVSSSFRVVSTGNPTASLTESGALPAGVSFVDNGNGTGTLSGTPSAGGTFAIVFGADNGVGSDATQSFTLTVTSTSQAPSITSGSRATFTEGQGDSFTVVTDGDPSPTITETGSLPSGVTFTDNENGTANLAGIPTSTGTFPLTLTAANGVNPEATQSFTLTVEAAPAITSVATATFTEGSAGTFTMTSMGYPTPSLSKTGALPSGVSFTDNGDGTATLSGTPTSGARGTYPLTVTASNGVNPAATQSFTFVVDAVPVITSPSAATFTVGSSGTFAVSSAGNPTPVVSESGMLPGGVTFVAGANGTAILSGDPAPGSGGSYTVTIAASNGVSPDATQSFTLTVDEGPTVTSASSAIFVEGSSGSFSVTSTGYPTASLTETGGLPSGLTFTDNGNETATLAGTPAVGTRGNYPITITAANGIGTNATQSFTLVVDAAPAITSSSATAFTTGSAGTFTVTASGRPNPSLSETGSLPAGVSFVDNGNGTATLSGTPRGGTGGTYPITVAAANGVNPGATQSFTLTVDQAPAITTANHVVFDEGAASNFTVGSTGYPVAALLESGALPSGISFTDNGDGTATLAGTPTATGTYPLTLTASNGVSPNATQSFTLTVGTPPAFTSANSSNFPLGTTSSFHVTATGNPVPTITASGSLPRGVSFANGVLSGRPTQGGTYQIGLVANNGVNPQAVQYFTLNVSGLQIVTTSLPAATVAHGYGVQLAAVGGITPLKWSKLSGLPRGLKLNRAGLLAGTVSIKVVPGKYTVSVKVTDRDRPKQVVTASFSLTVNP